MWNHETLHIVKPILRKKSKSGGTTISEWTIYYKGIVIKTPGYCQKDNHKDQWCGMWSTKINPHIHRLLISVLKLHVGVRTVLSTSGNGRPANPRQKNEIESLSDFTCKTQIKMS